MGDEGGDGATDHGDHEPEQDGPDPVARVPAEALAPCRREPPEESAAAPESEAAFEAVLLAGAVGRPTARAAALLASRH